MKRFFKIQATSQEEQSKPVIDKKEFRKIVLENNHRFGKSLKIGSLTFNGGKVYSESESGWIYVGKDADKKLVDYLWTRAIKFGSFSFDNDNYIFEDKL